MTPFPQSQPKSNLELREMEQAAAIAVALEINSRTHLDNNPSHLNRHGLIDSGWTVQSRMLMSQRWPNW